jgi:predicted transposase YdaD
MTEKTTNAASTEVNKDDKQENADQDGFWKELVKRFCYSLIKRAIPELYEKVDLEKEPRPLDKEFTDVVNIGNPNFRVPPHFADLVFEVPLKDGSNTWIIFHVEAQGPKGGNLPERMNHYRCYIYAHYRREPVALAIITGGRRKEERFYAHSHFGTEITYRYNNLILADLDDAELQASDNPIDLALYSARCALKAKEELQKYKYLRTLLDLLAERGWSMGDKRDLLLFLEWIIDLKDKELEKQYTEYRDKLCKEGKIVYIPLGERELAKEIEQRGIALGKEEMAREAAKNLLANGVSPDVIAQSFGLPVERVRTLVS